MEKHSIQISVVQAAYKLQQHNPSVTQFHEIAGLGHSLVIDHGWREVAEIAFTLIAEQLSTGQ